MVFSAQGSGDQEALSAYETGPNTGVFERRIRLTFGYANPQDQRLQTLRTDHISVQCGGYPPVVEADVLGPTVHFLDAGGHETATVVTGFPLRLRATDQLANMSPWTDMNQVRLVVPGGDNEVVTLLETGSLTAIFEASIPLVEGPAVPGDGTLQVAAGSTVEARLLDLYGTTLATATATAAQRLLTFRDAAGAPLSTLIEGDAVRVELLDATMIGQTNLQATAHSQIAGDTESVDLSPDPEIAGRFEGILYLGPYLAYPYNGHLTTYRTYSQPYQFDTVTVQFCEGCPTATATATTGNPEIRLLDTAGHDATVFAAGTPVRVRVFYPMLYPGYPETYARLESLTTGDLLSYLVLGATGGSVFEGQVSTATGAAAADSILQVQPGEILKATHIDYMNQPSNFITARIQEAILEFTDAAGAPQSEFLIGRPVYLRAVDPTANANPALAETLIASIDVEVDTGFPRDRETLTLTETGPNTGLFAGSIPMAPYVSHTFDNGVLEAGVERYRGDVLHARLADATATASTVQSQLRFVDAQGNDVELYLMGSAVYVRLEEPMANQPGQQDQGMVRIHSFSTGDWELFLVTETGRDTGIFTGSIAVGSGPASLNSNVLEVEAGETIEADHYSYYYPHDSYSADRASFAPNRAPAVQNESVSILEDNSITVDVLANDSDPEGQPLTVTNVVSYYGSGTVTINPDSSITFTPYPNNFGYTEVLTYTVSDGELTTTGTLSIEVISVIDPPVAGNDEQTTYEDFSVLLSVLDNDSDPDGYPLELVGFSTPAHGTVEPHPLLRTEYQYIPAPDFNGTDSFTYTVRDSEGATSTATVTITVLPVDDPPFVLNDAATTAEDTAVTVSVLANDSDVDSTLTVTSVAQPAHGSAVVNGDMTVTYTPAPNFSGTDSFDYFVQADTNNAVATVTVTVTPVNDVPDAVNDSATTNEDTAVIVSVRSNDTDPENNTLTVTAVTQGTKGVVTINGGTTVTYTPNANANGSDSFTYTISDGNGGTDTATVSVTITAVNDAPDAVNDSATTNEDTAVTVSVLDNDTDAENNTLTVTAVTQGTKGTVAINGSTTVTYTPNANANGSDSFTYTISDGNGGTDTATVSITITAVNDAPDAVNDSATTNEDVAVTVSVRDNDTDLDNDTLTVTAVTQGAKGTVTINDGTTVTYTPNANANGSDSFTYTISDGNGGTDTATVSITITAVNDAPDAVNDSATTNEDSAVTVSVLGNDTDAENNTLTVTAVTQGTKGTVTINGGTTVTYTPNANVNGTDSFTYTISDGNGGTDTATVSITITGVNDAPDAINDAATTNEDTAVTVSVRDNDTDLDNDTLTVTAVTQGTKGTVTINSGTTVTYTPNANANGSDSFTYTISDGNGGMDTATVAITINAVNDAPDAVNDVAATNEDTAVSISVLGNDTDPENNTLAITAVTQGTKGSVAINGSTILYTPNANTNGADAFTYTISDGNGGTDTATVTVNVAAVNDPPVASNDAGTTREGAAVTITVLSNDSDVESALTVTGTSTPAHGSAAVNANNTVTYTPVANFNGTDSFTYTVSDGQGGTASATVTVTVKDALERTAILATHSVWIQAGADVLSGDVIVNQTGVTPFLDSGVELSVGGTVTTPSGYDIQANRINIAAGSTLTSDAFYNTRTGAGSVTGTQTSPLALPVFATLPAFSTATPGTTDVNVAVNGTLTLTAGSYRDLIVAKKGTVTFTGGVYHFRSIQLNSQVKLFFSAAAEIRVQQKVSTLDLVQIQPATGATIDGSDVIFFVEGINGTTGTLAATPKAVEIGMNGVVWANVYAPNGTIWIKSGTQARGAHLGKDVQVGPDVQVTLDSYWIGQ